MGMYDYINYECDCPNCGKKIKDFQSKDGPCAIITLDWWEVRNFYSRCDNEDCRTWMEFSLPNLRRSNRKLTIKDYKVRIEKPTKKDNKERKKKLNELFGGK